MRGGPSARGPILVEATPNARWYLDLVHDQFACGQHFCVLNIVDDVTRECLARSNAILAWSQDHIVDWPYIERGKPIQNAYIESSTAACATFGFDHTCSAHAEWVEDYNTGRSHSSLGYQPPATFAATGSTRNVY